MRARRGGRRRKNGDRYPSGRLRPARDYGNDRARAHRDLFLRHGQMRPGDDLDCALGQAHAAGLLDGTRVDSRLLLEHGREWHRLHRLQYGGRVRTTSFERLDRSAPDLAVNGADLRFRAWSRIVDRLDAGERACLHLVCVEHGEGWSLPPFLERLIDAWKSRHGIDAGPGARLQLAGDAIMLEKLKSALVALAEGGRRRVSA